MQQSRKELAEMCSGQRLDYIDIGHSGMNSHGISMGISNGNLQASSEMAVFLDVFSMSEMRGGGPGRERCGHRARDFGGGMMAVEQQKHMGF
jgi:hypothetical protein